MDLSKCVVSIEVEVIDTGETLLHMSVASTSKWQGHVVSVRLFDRYLAYDIKLLVVQLQFLVDCSSM